ncbi:2-amino-4-hydroxy-6-hydroxymethyldihydropteridine diphosphokinase [Halpernia sp.]|uniref:2-amino-4-hydroxy-6- hydroxymethyldihydropteridine diphosphokinase n=1 Tax=Halpernia sp. TaxID=2782209 RepID=UPI003A907207
MSQHLVVLLLGSNLGKIKKNIDKAINLIENEIGKILDKSQYLETEPLEYKSSNNFCNIAVSLNTFLSPLELLKKLKKIERKMGREKDSAEFGFYSDRIIDIDIIYFNKLTFISKKLNLPHYKHINERDFSKKLISQLKDK